MRCLTMQIYNGGMFQALQNFERDLQGFAGEGEVRGLWLRMVGKYLIEGHFILRAFRIRLMHLSWYLTRSCSQMRMTCHPCLLSALLM